MSEQLDRIENMLGQLIKMVGATNAKVDDTNTKIDHLATRVERQDAIIETLSIRSIAQEAILKKK